MPPSFPTVLKEALIDLEKGSTYEPVEEWLAKAEAVEFDSVSDFLKFVKEELSWDLWSALSFCAQHIPYLDKDIENGSCQNTHHRQVAQLCCYHGCKPEDFYNWST